MQSDSAPPTADGTNFPVADRPDDDPVRRLLETPPSTARRLQLRHWAGVATLTATIGGAAVVVPPLISAAGPAPSASGTGPAGPSLPESRPTVSAPRPPGASGAAAGPGTVSTRPFPDTYAGGGVGTAAPRVSVTTPATATATTTAAAPRTTTSREAASGPLRIQAEDGVLSEGASVTDCESCEGGARVRYIGRVEARFTVASPGERTITISYAVNGTRKLNVTVNGTAVMTARRVSGTSWDTPVPISATVTVPAGPVTIAVFGDNNAPDLDAISIS